MASPQPVSRTQPVTPITMALLILGFYLGILYLSARYAFQGGPRRKNAAARMYWGFAFFVQISGIVVYLILSRHDTGIEQNATLGVIVAIFGLLLAVIGFVIQAIAKAVAKTIGGTKN